MLPPMGGTQHDASGKPNHSRNASGQAMIGAGSNAKPLLPFDLNNLITLSHSFELLKDTLENLASN